ncbi:MAG: hypothetical protein R6U63_12175 [Longimicrobiales bacterium]
MYVRTAPFALALAALLATGCGGDQPDGGSDTAARGGAGGDAEDASGSAATTAGSTAAVAAEVLLEDRPSGVSLRVTLAGLVPDRRYPVHVHEGECGGGGRVSLPLGRVTAGPDGTGSVRMSVAEDRLPERPFSVRVLDPDGSPVACEDVDAAPG